MTVDQALQQALDHHRGGRLREAEAIYRQVLREQPNNLDALRLLGLLLVNVGQHQAGMQLLERALALSPASQLVRATAAEAMLLVGVARRLEGRLAEAIDACQRAIALQPDYAEAHSNLSDALRAVGRLDDALAAADAALRLLPDFPQALHNRGVALMHLRRREQALAAFDAAIAADPNYASAHVNRGNVLTLLGCEADALEAYERAVAIDPKSAEALSNLGGALQAAHRLDEALAAHRAAVQADPTHPEARSNFANALRDTGDISAAIAEYRAAIAVSPGHSPAWHNLLYCLASDPSISGEAIFAEHVRWGEMIASAIPPTTLPRPEVRGRRMRIGYVSPDLRHHPIGRLMLPLLRHHDRDAFEIFCYADLWRDDDITARLRADCEHWRDTIELDHSQLAQLIRRDGIDVLVDLAAHTAGNRLLTFARRAAPVQVTYLGYPGTTGLPTMDWRITDRFLDPLDENRRFNTERLMHLTTTYWCYSEPPAAPAVSPPPMRSNGYVTFGCLNPFARVTEPTLRAWRRILDAVPKSRLILRNAGSTGESRVREILGERVECVPTLAPGQYFSIYGRLDITLDPFPCGGATTTCDSLWMAVPVVTLAGDVPLRRSAAAILPLAALDDLVTTDIDTYIATAAALARDEQRLTDLRATLRERVRSSALMNAAAHARDIERCYHEFFTAL